MCLSFLICFPGRVLCVVRFYFPVKSITHSLLFFCAGLLQISGGQRSILKCDFEPREVGKGTQQQEK